MSFERTQAFLALKQNPTKLAQENPENTATPNSRSSSPPKQTRRNSTPTTTQKNPQPQLSTAGRSSTVSNPAQNPKNDDVNQVSDIIGDGTIDNHDPGMAGVTPPKDTKKEEKQNLKEPQPLWDNLIKGIKAMQNNQVQLIPLDLKIKKIVNLNLPETVARFINLCQHYVTHSHPILGTHDANAKFLIKFCRDLADQRSLEFCKNDLHRNFYYFILIHTFYHHLIKQKSQSFLKLLNDYLFNATHGNTTNLSFLFLKNETNSSSEINLPNYFIEQSNALLELFKKKNDSERSVFWNEFITQINFNSITQPCDTQNVVNSKEKENEKEEKETTSSEGKDEGSENPSQVSTSIGVGDASTRSHNSPPASPSTSPKTSILSFSTFNTGVNTGKSDLENEKGDKNNSSPNNSPKNS